MSDDEDFQKRLERDQERGMQARLNDEPPPGLLPDGKLNIVQPGEPERKPTTTHVHIHKD